MQIKNCHYPFSLACSWQTRYGAGADVEKVHIKVTCGEAVTRPGPLMPPRARLLQMRLIKAGYCACLNGFLMSLYYSWASAVSQAVRDTAHHGRCYYYYYLTLSHWTWSAASRRLITYTVDNGRTSRQSPAFNYIDSDWAVFATSLSCSEMLSS